MKDKLSSIIINNIIIGTINLMFTGVIVAYWLIPLATRHLHQREIYYNKRIELANNFIMDFTQYRLNRQRLILVGLEEIKGAKRGWKLDKEFYANKEAYRISRDGYRDKLYRDLQLTTLFFSPAVTEEGNKFIAWDSFYATKAKKLPNDSKMSNWQHIVTNLMKHELTS